MSFETELQEILKNRKVRNEECPEVSLQEKEKEEFREQFTDLNLSLIKPILVTIRRILKESGEQALVKEIPYSFGPGGREHLASVSLYLNATADMDSVTLHRCPHVSFLCDPCNKVIRSHKNIMAHHNHGGISYTTGSFSVDEFNAAVIEEKVMDMIKEVYLN